jgi:hypothetical protein
MLVKCIGIFFDFGLSLQFAKGLLQRTDITILNTYI